MENINFEALDKILARKDNKKPIPQNYKKRLELILDRTEVALNTFNHYKNGIEKDYEREIISGKGREKKLNELIERTGEQVERIKEDALIVIDEGVKALTEAWEEKTRRAYSDSVLNMMLANINNGAIPEGDELKALIKPYMDNPTALEMIEKALEKNGGKRLIIQYMPAENPKEKTLRLMESVRKQFANYWNRNGLVDLPIAVQGLKDFIDRLADDLTVIA